MSKVTCEKVSYGGWPNCVRLTNGRIEVIATTDVGPRIIRCGFCGESNLFNEVPEHLGKTGGDKWTAYGGHRLWHAPESVPRTYFPDNEPIVSKWDGHMLLLSQPMETTTGIAKQIEIKMSADEDRVTLRHRLLNQGLWDVNTAVWCLSVMAPGGTAILPHEPFIPFPDMLLPARPLVLWTYTDMSDPRFTWGRRLIRIKQDSKATNPQKIGIWNGRGWGAYWNAGTLFLKRTTSGPSSAYPDFGCNWEVYTNADMLELETLGPLTRVPAMEGLTEHVEEWFLAKTELHADDAQAEAELARFQL